MSCTPQGEKQETTTPQERFLALPHANAKSKKSLPLREGFREGFRTMMRKTKRKEKTQCQTQNLAPQTAKTQRKTR